MKQTLTIIAILFSSVGMGQDSMINPVFTQTTSACDTCGIILQSSSWTRGAYRPEMKREIKIDTVWALILFSDTIDSKYISMIYSAKVYEVTEVEYIEIEDAPVYPRNSYTLELRLPTYKKIAFYTHIKYLDENKKELPKELVVWQSIKL